MTREEFESILEEAFLAGYNDAIDEIFEEDSSFDLEDEMDSYLESNKETKARNREIGKRAFEKRLQNSSDIAKYYYNKGGTGNIQPETGRYYQGGEKGRLLKNIRLNHELLKDGNISAKDLARSFSWNRYNRKNDHDRLPK